jgi:hypothetical protein
MSEFTVYRNHFPINLHEADMDIFTFYMRLDLQNCLRPSHKNLKEDQGVNGKIMYNVMLKTYTSVIVYDIGVQSYVKQHFGWHLVRFPQFVSNLNNPELVLYGGSLEP